MDYKAQKCAFTVSISLQLKNKTIYMIINFLRYFRSEELVKDILNEIAIRIIVTLKQIMQLIELNIFHC